MNLDQEHAAVTTYENTADTKTPIFEVLVPDKTVYTLENNTLLVMDLRDSNGDKISANSRIEVAGRAPTQNNNQDIDQKPYRPYHQIDITDQYNNENQGKLLIEVDNGYIDFIEQHKIIVSLKSSDVVDWDNVNTVLEFEVVEEPYREHRSRQ